MTIRGHVHEGQLILDERLLLPEGAEVTVNVQEVSEPNSGQSIPALYERMSAVIGKANGLPSDASENVDHYLYGAPRK